MTSATLISCLVLRGTSRSAPRSQFTLATLFSNSLGYPQPPRHPTLIAQTTITSYPPCAFDPCKLPSLYSTSSSATLITIATLPAYQFVRLTEHQHCQLPSSPRLTPNKPK
ncbi:hypothetical protein PGTUg99_037324 [Puccinia graminis f. sp. tritici]|uniref:Uncharacterized protein n=1 Tax=Puccinia graminis f. sp. tritici TaxID=56615 RepID=A0A5B0NLV4_PUCGR|nr:hypothetical protein PGTUg99_037324 [Puccinia graminis f. sp. tritici]